MIICPYQDTYSCEHLCAHSCMCSCERAGIPYERSYEQLRSVHMIMIIITERMHAQSDNDLDLRYTELPRKLILLHGPGP